MLDKKQQGQRENEQKDKRLNKFRYSHLDLCFNYSNPKQKQRKQLSPLVLQPTPQNQSPNMDQPKFRLSFRLTKKMQPFPEASSTSFFKKTMKKPTYLEKTEEFGEADQMPYIGWGFPQRKRKSGDQQFLKLLLKYSDNLLIASAHEKRERSEGHSEQNPQKTQKIRPKLKVRTRINWVKERYCVNRDKQRGLFCGSVMERNAKPQEMPFRSDLFAKKQQK